MKQQVYSTERGYRRLKEGVDFESYKAKYPSAIKVRKPGIRTMETWISNGIAKTPCGCKTEPDGYCSHNRPSWLIVLGYI